MSRFNRFAMAVLGLATVALYGSRAVIALRDTVGPRPVPTAVAAMPLAHSTPSLHVGTSRPRHVAAATTNPLRGRPAEGRNPLLRFVNAGGPLVPTEDRTAAAAAPRMLDAPQTSVPPTASPEPAAAEAERPDAPSSSSAVQAEEQPAATAATVVPEAAEPPPTVAEDVVVVQQPAPDAEANESGAGILVVRPDNEPGLVTSVATMAELADKFRDADYSFEDVAAGRPVPRIIIRRFPKDLRDEEAAEARKMMFLQALLPIVLYKNQEIRRDRERLLALRDAKLEGDRSDAADSWLDRLYARYRVEKGDMDELLTRVDVIPPSLALAQAATESGWGTSRSAREGNALFGEYASNGDNYAIRSFDALLKSAQSYALNLNTHRAYRAMRAKRAEMREAGKPLDGYVLAATLNGYSELGSKYVRYVRRMIKENRLSTLDQARLVGDDAALATASD